MLPSRLSSAAPLGTGSFEAAREEFERTGIWPSEAAKGTEPGGRESEQIMLAKVFKGVHW